jgi:parvulin-like peptidyl-prolyl isomerase
LTKSKRSCGPTRELRKIRRFLWWRAASYQLSALSQSADQFVRKSHRHFWMLCTAAVVVFWGARLRAQYETPPAAPIADPQQMLQAPPADDITPVWQADAANLEGCQVIARIDNQIVLACDVLWRVNQMIENYQTHTPPDKRVPPEQMQETREQLMKREIAAMLDRKLLYDEFRRNVPQENLPRVEQELLKPFEERELPELMKELKVNNQQDLERELARLGSSIADVRRAFNEKVIASEWVRSKIKINEEVSPEEMLDYYKSHLADYEYPTQARWEELMVKKVRFDEAQKAYVELAHLGNEVWTRGTAAAVQGPAFAEIAKVKSDGFTAEKGGEHDWTTKGSLQCVELDQALFTLQVGQMSAIIDSGPAFHIVRVLERKEAGRKPFTEVQGDIRLALKEQRMRAAMDVYIAKLRSDARIWTAFTGNVSADVLLGKRPGPTQTR